MKLFKTLKKALWEVLAEQEPFGIVNNQNIDYYLEKTAKKIEKEINEMGNKENKQNEQQTVESEELSYLVTNCIILGMSATETAEYLMKNGYSKARR